ncbi:TrlF family AAA-like ATPase [Rhodococcus sp. NPDC077669]|uniref:TrlF family AAA-like ATPase n=1 Tax=Rhodococcus sp. NPDC077669 TaxID=3155174 RepID=UPI00343C8A4B
MSSYEVEYARGSEWRKWDLHVHVPSATGAENRYTMLANGEPDWDRFSTLVEASDVAVVGITDYFNLDRYFDFVAAFRRKFPTSDKRFLPNMEVRLNEAVNKAGEEVNLHLIFSDSLTVDDADRFMRSLRTELHTSDDRQMSCRDLKTAEHLGSATVTRKAIADAIRDTFGVKNDQQDSVLILTSAKGDGIRPQRGAKRKANLTDEIDKMSDGFFGRSTSSEYFLNTSRLENEHDEIRAKPVFSGCDAHTFDDLKDRLGKSISDGPNQTEVTWVKADPTFSGLRQTLIEPLDRVRIQPTIPDSKEPYNVISSVSFSDTSTFPAEIKFNQNLCSIIGSRSSGKSSLLAYISHAVDPQLTVEQQIAARIAANSEAAGPAAGYRWSQVPAGTCQVNWGGTAGGSGQVIYIPQNSLYAISERPDEITQKIKPALFRDDAEFRAATERATADLESADSAMEHAIKLWFDLSLKIEKAEQDLRSMGDPDGIAAVRDELAAEINKLRDESSLTPEQVQQYEEVIQDIATSRVHAAEIEEKMRQLSVYVEPQADSGNSAGQLQNWAVTEAVGVQVETIPTPSDVHQTLASEITNLVLSTRESIRESLSNLLVNARTQLEADLREARLSGQRLEAENADLIAMNAMNAELDSVVQRHQNQVETLKRIEVQKDAILRLTAQQAESANSVKGSLGTRNDALATLRTVFDRRRHELDEMVLGMEISLNPDTVEALSQDLHKQNKSPFLTEDKVLNLAHVQANPEVFMRALASGTQKVKQGRSPADVAAAVLQATPEVRYFAELDGDRVGGFAVSTMTPGKQALFALTLILNESTDKWPLLIDQPEDDLDSRSIFEQIVPYLVKRKSDRQIIMVTHDANLAVGADSEQIIVANRHGDDRPNANGRTFDYRSGSLEHSGPMIDHAEALKVCGTREHACLILDGGEDAFRKRRQKYQI